MRIDVYSIEHKGITCTGVDWTDSPSRFFFSIGPFQFVYKQNGQYNCKADTDHIRCVIDEFIDNNSEVVAAAIKTANANREKEINALREYDRNSADKDVKQNAAYWDALEQLATNYLREMLSNSYPLLKLDDDKEVELSKTLTEFAVSLLEKQCGANFPVVSGEF